MLFAFTLMVSSGMAQINLASTKLQRGIIYLKTGDSIVCDIKVFKQDTLHNSDRVRYRLPDEDKLNAVQRSKIKAVRLGRNMYHTFKYGTDVIGALIRDGDMKLYMVSSAGSSGYTVVADKADVMTLTFYVEKDGNVIRMERQSLLDTDEHAAVMKNLKKIFKNCTELKVFMGKYEKIPEYFDQGLKVCGKS